MNTLKDLLEEAKRRTILVAILSLVLAYAMSLTSSSVWINLPIAILVLAALRRLSFDVEIRWKLFESEHSSTSNLHQRQLGIHDPLLSEASHAVVNRWRHQFDSPVVEAAVDDLTKGIIDEWVTNLWYSSVTPDQEAPEELRILINGVIAEVSQRAKRVNLITLLSRDVVDLVGTQFALYRRMKASIGSDIIDSLSTEERDEKLKQSMLASRELHPALISPEAEYQVLKRLTGGVVALVLKRQDARCRLLRIMARELLACVVLRPVINLASPAFINEMIENFALASHEKARLAAEETAEAARAAKQRLPDRVMQRKPSVSGLEMTSLSKSETIAKGSGIVSSKKNDERLSASVGDIGMSSVGQQGVHDDVEQLGPIPRGDWAQVLDAVTQRRAQALTPEHLDNLWAKGRNYKKRENQKAAAIASGIQSNKDSTGRATEVDSVSKVPKMSTTGKGSPAVTDSADVVLATSIPLKKKPSNDSEQYKTLLFGDPKDDEGLGIRGIGFSPIRSFHRNSNRPDGFSNTQLTPGRKASELMRCRSNEDLTSFSSDYQSMAANSTRVLDGDRNLTTSKFESHDLHRPQRRLTHRKSRSMGGELDGWLQSDGWRGEGLSTLLSAEEGPLGCDAPLKDQKLESSVVKPEREEAQTSQLAMKSSPQVVPKLLKCRVMGAHFEKSGSNAFAVYTIKVTDTHHQRWRVERRYRNFEQLHRRLKDVPSYNLSLPPKRFLSSSLDTTFVRERCILLDKYLKDLLAIPSLLELPEVCDFFSVNSQHYAFGISPPMMETIAVNVDDAMDDMFRQLRGVSDNISGALNQATNGILQRLPLGSGDVDQVVSTSNTQINRTSTSESSGSQRPEPLSTLIIPDSDFGEKGLSNSTLEEEYEGNYRRHSEDAGRRVGSFGLDSDSETAADSLEANAMKSAVHLSAASQSDMRANRLFGRRLERALSDSHSPVDSFASDGIEDDLVIPQEWSPPKVTVPLLNLVDQIFQLQGRGWIRRQVLWIAKQVLQLGMGDAFDDWLIARIQWLRREEVVASGVQWLKGVLWPDGIFVTKHPRNSPPSDSSALENNGMEFSDESKAGQQHPPANLTEQKLEAARRATVVREIILDKAPAPLVSIIGRKQYTRCAKDIYYFSQASVCIKQLAYSFLEMLLLATFPELHDLVLDVRSSVM